jgi:hypothetical protein
MFFEQSYTGVVPAWLHLKSGAIQAFGVEHLYLFKHSFFKSAGHRE